MAEWAGQWAGLAGNYTRGVVRRLVELPGMTVCSDPDLTLDQARSLKLGRCPTSPILLISSVPPYLAAVGSEDSGSFCCPPVVDSATWLAVVGGIAIVTFFLRMASADITLCYKY